MDGVDVHVLDSPVDDVLLPAHKPHSSCLLWRLGKTEGGSVVNGAEELHVPGLPVLGVGDGGRGDDDVGEVLDRQE